MKFVLYLPQAPVVQKVDNAIHQINHYSLDSTIGFPNTLIDLCHAAAILSPLFPATFKPFQDFFSLLNIQEGCTLKKGC